MSLIPDDKREYSPPPRYSEAVPETDIKSPQGHGGWLVQRTSIHIESSAVDSASSISPSESTGSRYQHRRFRSEAAKRRGSETSPDGSRLFDGHGLGSQVIIEAAKPLRTQAERRIELKGLEQAASLQRWTGSSQPAEAWGKLMKDPELWDPEGDTYIYFGYGRPNASFRIKSAVLEDTKSQVLQTKLREGARRDVKAGRPASTSPSNSTSSISGMKSLSISKSRRPAEIDETSNVPICYELYFPAPQDASRMDVIRHHTTTRNFLAILTNKSLVGLTFYQALVDLQERIENLLAGADSMHLIMKYLLRNNLHNISNDPGAAAGLLTWSEDSLWKEGWREAYIHCNGTYQTLRAMPEFRDISHASSSLLEQSSREQHSRLREANNRLANFDFDDIWPLNTRIPTAFIAFRNFLLRHFEKKFRVWPPRAADTRSDAWLTRSLVQRLQTDFAALYKYYVNQDAIWSPTSESIIRRTDSAPLSSHKEDGLCLQTRILSFDRTHSFPHIPYPFPLLPQLNPTATGNVMKNHSRNASSIFSSKSKNMDKQISAASAAASNAIILGPEITNNSLVEAYLKFEKTERSREDDPRTVRKVRWLLLYGILQTLSRVGVTTPNLWFTEGVEYFLYASAEGTKPWTGSGTLIEEPSAKELFAWLDPSGL